MAPASSDSPLSGRANGAGKQVLVVKIDNTPAAQPHAGLRSADVVYIEEVEWGLTRLAAVFATEQPDVVGPVRSARITDLELLKNYGNAAFAYSGAQSKLIPVIGRSGLVDVSGDKSIRGYYRERGRRAPTNFMGKPSVLLDRAGDSAKARDIGFTFASAAPAGGWAATTLKARWPSSSLGAEYDAAKKNYALTLNGRSARAAEGGVQRATTIVVQYVKVTDSGYGDKFGGRTPMSSTVGSGTGLVLRNGQAYKMRWSRPTPTAETSFTNLAGQPLPFAPGQIWVALVNAKTPVSVR